MSNDFFVRQSEAYEFIIDSAEHVRIAVHGTEKERAAAVTRYIEACRINYMSVSEAVAYWRFAATSQEAYLAGLPLIHATAAAAAEEAEEKNEEETKGPEDNVETLVLDRYGDLSCPACGLQYSVFCSSFEDQKETEPCTLCNPQVIVDYKRWLQHVDYQSVKEG